MAKRSKQQWDFSELRALFFNGTLTRSPEPSHTDLLIKISTDIMQKHGVKTEVIRTVDHPDIATGIYPDMREHGWKNDEWPELYKKVQEADILVLAGPIWLGDNSSQTKKNYRAAVCVQQRVERARAVGVLRKSRRLPDNRQ